MFSEIGTKGKSQCAIAAARRVAASLRLKKTAGVFRCADR
jgi:hypothetical protein